jgi:hypothetical protein
MAELENIRHETFAQGIAKGMSQRKAYREAFPSSKAWKDETVDVRACELAKDSKVVVRLTELRGMATSNAIMSATERKEWLTKLIIDEEGKHNTGDRLKALDILNKMDGGYTEKVQVSGTLNNPFAGMTTEELREIVGDE